MTDAPPLAPRRARRPAPVPDRAPLRAGALPWVRRAPGAPYFQLETGEAWTPVGANESITWPGHAGPGLSGLFRRRDVGGARAYLRDLRAHGVTVRL